MTWSIRMSPVRHSQMQILCTAMSLFLLLGTVACASPASRQEIRNWIQLLRSDDPVKSSSAATSLLTSGDQRALEALLDSRHRGGVRTETPHLEVAYQSYETMPIRPTSPDPVGASLEPLT